MNCTNTVLLETAVRTLNPYRLPNEYALDRNDAVLTFFLCDRAHEGQHTALGNRVAHAAPPSVLAAPDRRSLRPSTPLAVTTSRSWRRMS